MRAVSTTDRTLIDEQTPLSSSEVALAGRYRLRGILGRGGMGTVYRAVDVELGETIALKIVGRATSSDDGLERQRDEVRLARRVTHPNVARTFDLGDDGGLRFITMELVDGPSLRDVIESDLPLDRRLALLAQIASGLGAIHGAGIAHRDMKPENVLVSADGIAKITDFGIARRADSVAGGMTTGTPRYMAPEVLAGAPPTPLADVYAFGLVAYEMLTRHRFLGGDPAPAERALHAAVGAEHAAVATFVMRCVASAPEARPQSVSAFAATVSSEHDAGPLPFAVAAPVRARLGACLFAADAPEAWLADSIPSEILRALSRNESLEVVATLLPSEGAIRAARELEIDVVLFGTVRRRGDELDVGVRGVSVREELQLFARNATVSIERIGTEMSTIAQLVVASVLDQSRGAATTREQDARVTELILRATHEEHDPWRDFTSGAAALLERAAAIAPDDPTVLALLARALLRGAGSYDSERYRRARGAAERSVELDGSSADAQLALAFALFITNDPLGALASLRTVHRLAPSDADANGLLGAITMDVGLLAEGLARSKLAMALDPVVAITRANAALASELIGDRSAADALVNDGLASDSPLARSLCAMLTARFAMWRGGPDAIDFARRRLESLDATPLAAPFLAAIARTATPGEVLASFGPVATVAPEWARQRCVRLQFEAELHAYRNELADAARAVAEMSAAGSYDIAWLDGCPLVARITRAHDLTPVRESIAARADRVRRALRELGLAASPRSRARR